MNDNNEYIKYYKDTILEIFEKKKRFHLEQAVLPIEEKIKRLVELQKIAITIRGKKDKDDSRMVWEIM